MSDKTPIPIRTKKQIAMEHEAEEMRWLKQLNRQTGQNRREEAHAEEKAQLRDALDRSERSNARLRERNIQQRKQNAEQRTLERRCFLGASTVRHMAILLTLALVLLNGMADALICIPAIGIMLFVVGFDMARIWIEFIVWLFNPKKRKSGGK